MFQQSLQFSKSYNVGHLYYPSGINCNENNYVRGSYYQIYYVNQQLPTYQNNEVNSNPAQYSQNRNNYYSLQSGNSDSSPYQYPSPNPSPSPYPHQSPSPYPHQSPSPYPNQSPSPYPYSTPNVIILFQFAYL